LNLFLAAIILFGPNYHGVPKGLADSIEHHESRGNIFAKSHAGAVGLMQVMPRFRDKRIPRKALWIPFVNIHEGTRILSRWKRRSKSWKQALMAYNAGNIGLRNESSRARHYANSVLRRWKRKDPRGYRLAIRKEAL